MQKRVRCSQVDDARLQTQTRTGAHVVVRRRNGKYNTVIHLCERLLRQRLSRQLEI